MKTKIKKSKKSAPKLSVLATTSHGRPSVIILSTGHPGQCIPFGSSLAEGVQDIIKRSKGIKWPFGYCEAPRRAYDDTYTTTRELREMSR